MECSIIIIHYFEVLVNELIFFPSFICIALSFRCGYSQPCRKQHRSRRSLSSRKLLSRGHHYSPALSPRTIQVTKENMMN